MGYRTRGCPWCGRRVAGECDECREMWRNELRETREHMASKSAMVARLERELAAARAENERLRAVARRFLDLAKELRCIPAASPSLVAAGVGLEAALREYEEEVSRG